MSGAPGRGAALLVASVGFDEGPITKALVHVKPRALLAIIPSAEGVARARLEKTLKFIEELSAMVGSRVEVVTVDRPVDVAYTVYTIKRSVEKLAKAVGASRIYISLKGGLRLLTLALILVAQSITQRLGGNVTLLIDDEKGEIVEFDAASLTPERLGEEERRVLLVLAEKTLRG